MSPSLGRVLAEAADDYRSGLRTWFVANRVFPHTIIGAFTDESDARRLARDSTRAGFEVYGPYESPRDEVRIDDVRVVSVTLTLQRGDSTTTLTVNPREIDALFFSQAAVRKFVLPYYARVYGVDWANQLGLVLPGGGTCHRYGTVYCEIRWRDIAPVFVPWPPAGRTMIPRD